MGISQHWQLCSALCCAGRPVNLSNNCSKHVLAEVKQAHVAHVARETGLDTSKAGLNMVANECKPIEQIPPPPWKPSVILPNLPALPSLQHGNSPDSDCEMPALEDDPAKMCLSAISQAVSAVEQNVMQPDDPSFVDQCMNAVLRVAASHGEFEKPRKKQPRGNFGFFRHVADTQSAMPPKQQGETIKDCRKRVIAQAKATWQVETLVIEKHQAWSIAGLYCRFGRAVVVIIAVRVRVHNISDQMVHRWDYYYYYNYYYYYCFRLKTRLLVL